MQKSMAIKHYFQSCWYRQPLNWDMFTNELQIKLNKKNINLISSKLTAIIPASVINYFA